MHRLRNAPQQTLQRALLTVALAMVVSGLLLEPEGYAIVPNLIWIGSALLLLAVFVALVAELVRRARS